MFWVLPRRQELKKEGGGKEGVGAGKNRWPTEIDLPAGDRAGGKESGGRPPRMGREGAGSGAQEGSTVGRWVLVLEAKDEHFN